MRRTALSLFVLLFVAACGPTGLRPTQTLQTLNLGATAVRRVETLTDLEEVRAVVQHQGFVYVGTDGGLLRYPENDVSLEILDGLPGTDVRGVAVDGNGLLVAIGEDLVSWVDGTVTPVDGAPNLGDIVDMDRTADGTVWLCGMGGVARRAQGGTWEVFGEPAQCTTLAPTPEGQLWVGTTQGLWYVEGDVVREHPISGGMPEGYVRAVVPVLPGQVFAILQGPNDAQLAHWDGTHWYGYTILGLDDQLVGLVRRGTQVLLVSQNRVLAIGPRGEGVPLVALSAETGTVRSYRARLQSAAVHQPGQLPSRDTLAEPRRLADRPENSPTVRAPSFLARPLDVTLPGRAYGAYVQGEDAFLAIANHGVLELPAQGPSRPLVTRTLVPEGDLHIATDRTGTVWTISREHHLARFHNDRLRRAPVPEGNIPEAVATGPQGAYLVTRAEGTPNTVRVFQNAGQGWNQLAERTLELATPLVRVPFAGVSNDGRVWVALEVVREDDVGNRLRGVAVIDPSSPTVLYHHRGADRAAGGLELPDEISAVDFDTENAWFSSLSGLVRVGASQAVVFGEARGVRGEVVSDAAVGSDLIWLAAAEGLASYDRSEFNFSRQPANVQSMRPTRLAIDDAGHLWATSHNGLILQEGPEWVVLDANSGLPTSTLVDVEVDEGGRVWILAEDRVMILER
ncbi:MAG: hypothetical protein H6719_22735 [Sandaracinaceae bacterium]|nr:hypothetical protein [Sandaracinaceae bacterium]